MHKKPGWSLENRKRTYYLEKNGLQESVHLTVEKRNEDGCQHIAGTEADEKQCFGYGLCTLQNSRQ